MYILQIIYTYKHAIRTNLIQFKHHLSIKYIGTSLEVQDQTKNGLWDGPYKGFPTTYGQSLVFGLPGTLFMSHKDSSIVYFFAKTHHIYVQDFHIFKIQPQH